MSIVYLEKVESCNGWLILRRTGAQAKAERLPRYVISTPDTNSHLEEFRLLRTARQWCTHNNDYAYLATSTFAR